MASTQVRVGMGSRNTSQMSYIKTKLITLLDMFVPPWLALYLATLLCLSIHATRTHNLKAAEKVPFCIAFVIKFLRADWMESDILK